MRRLALILSLLLVAGAAHADEQDRLVKLAHAWSAVKFLDPALVSGGVDWDGALVRAIPKVRAATSEDQLADAVNGMLRELGDPATRVVSSETATVPADPPLLRWEGDVLVVNAGAYDAAHPGVLYGTGATVSAAIAKARSVVIDMRGPANLAADVAELVEVFNGLSAKLLVAPSSRYVMHSGYATGWARESGSYFSGFLTLPGPVVETSPGGHAPERVAFVVEEGSLLPSLALALRAAGKAVIVSATPVGEALAADTVTVPLGEHHAARVRTSQSLLAGVHADVVDPDPLAAALRFARGEIQVNGGEAAPPPELPADFKPAAERSYDEMQPPDVNYRLLALFRFWSIIDRFYPFKSQIPDWDRMLHDFIPRFIAADDADQYGLALRELSARVEDSHAALIASNGFRLFSAEWPLPFAVRPIEGQYVITTVADGELPVKVGDVLVSVDGEPIQQRVQRLWKYIPSSTDAARRLRVANGALWGPKGSVARLEIRSAGGTSTVSVARVERFEPPQATTGPTYRLLAGNVGYVDLTRLDPLEVDAMFEALSKTKALIFDMRGHPKGTGWLIAARLNTRHATTGAIFRRPEFSGATPFDQQSGGFFFDQPMPTTDKPLYQGKTVMLIDERAVSEAEWTALFFEAANGTAFIGTPTAGAVGDPASFMLPGGFRFLFTGHDVRHADGRPVQNLGIQPTVSVAPTIAGIRAGRDEVLDRAIEYVADATN
jgi:C-terminal processing protease CtpA/Prc